MALLIRAELFEPGLQILQTKEQYNQLFTMHGTAMLLMFATPLFAGFTNVIMPLQIGAPDVAFPRLNALAFWFFLFGSTIAVSGFITPQGAASFGWFAYAPLSNTTFTRASVATSGCSAWRCPVSEPSSAPSTSSPPSSACVPRA
jgi:cytochrome c oxidase subunit 1